MNGWLLGLLIWLTASMVLAVLFGLVMSARDDREPPPPMFPDPVGDPEPAGCRHGIPTATPGGRRIDCLRCITERVHSPAACPACTDGHAGAPPARR